MVLLVPTHIIMVVFTANINLLIKAESYINIIVYSEFICPRTVLSIHVNGRLHRRTFHIMYVSQALGSFTEN
jgi:hypothetical protein